MARNCETVRWTVYSAARAPLFVSGWYSPRAVSMVAAHASGSRMVSAPYFVGVRLHGTAHWPVSSPVQHLGSKMPPGNVLLS